MILPDQLSSRIASFPKEYMTNFDYVWKRKIKVEINKSSHILDENNIKEFYNRLSFILPKWQTYRNGDNANPLKTLRESLANISDAYDQIRKFTILEFDEVPRKALEVIWHELGRVKERNGEKNKSGSYFAISVCKPLLLLWGQTLAFDSKVRKCLPKNYGITSYFSKWTLETWIKTMRKTSHDLKANPELVDFIDKESERRYGKEAIVPYGRFLDICYWVGP